jgi:hypothetical protein
VTCGPVAGSHVTARRRRFPAAPFHLEGARSMRFPALPLRLTLLWILLLALPSGLALAARCGDEVPDPGEECDHGKYNGATCCDSACRWVPTDARCVPPHGDPCRQGRCDAQHICVAPGGQLLDPCSESTSCRGCVISGRGPDGFACSGAVAADGAPCGDEDMPDHRCTTDSCSDGVCSHVPKACPDPGKTCMVAACNPDTGTCENKKSTDAACRGKSP